MNSERRSHIILIDDNPADIDLFKRALQSSGLECDLTVIEDGAEAIALVRRQGQYVHATVPDLVVLDLNLPKRDGFEVLQAMRESEGFAGVPVAILSSSSSLRERSRLAQFRIGRYLTKPPDLDEFLKIGVTIKELLAESKPT